jgi:LAO/AO transport system kinase
VSSDLIDEVGRGDRRAVSRLITELIERPTPELLSTLLRKPKRAPIVGITGPPGSGKSTLVNRLITHWRSDGRRPGVILIDPSSPFTGGAILGDRVRMQEHAGDVEVFMRSLAARGKLGGLAEGVDSVARALDLAGFDPLVIETVGVGQSEIDVMRLADTVVVVLHPGWGDSVQASKAGLMEAADIFCVNKSDQPGADRVESDLQQMVAMNPPGSKEPRIVLTSALNGNGISDLAEAIAEKLEQLANAQKPG